MKLYTGDLSPYSAKVRMQIYAKGIKDEVHFTLPADFRQGKFSETSPLGRIPVLVLDDGSIIPESEVISEYLEEVFPERSMLGSDPKIRADVRTLSRIADIYLMNNIFLALPQINRKTRSEPIRDMLMSQVTRGMGALEQHIWPNTKEGEFAVGDTMTIADCTLVPALWMCQKTVPTLDVPNPIEGNPKVAAYWAKIQKNDIAAKVIAEIDAGLQRRLDGTEGQPGAT
jgi:glutathione S-transferase